MADDVVVRLRRIEGQVRGLQRLAAEGADEELLTQLAAAVAGLRRVAAKVLVRAASREDPERLTRLLDRYSAV